MAVEGGLLLPRGRRLSRAHSAASDPAAVRWAVAVVQAHSSGGLARRDEAEAWLSSFSTIDTDLLLLPAWWAGREGHSHAPLREGLSPAFFPFPSPTSWRRAEKPGPRLQSLQAASRHVRGPQ
ncbi:hypothetical protein AAFF_G00405800 [Aldrovandia affinis]|uniref:Uncharacterized protein n=1 Tax=Aldrovandia affinis TaxID=143900 RepID=A0AAD7SC98_9TELE|nr:hypothetical protein AAFF_G00405800 [Aldrovandia affinis]